MPQKHIIEYLNSHKIKFKTHTHEAVFTCETANKLQIPGIQAKTLILRNKKKSRYFMVIMPGSKRLDLKNLSAILNTNKLSFASPEDLEKILQVTPGSCSPLGLIFDKDQILEVHLDQDVADSDIVNFHPNDNTASLELTQENFQKFLQSIPHEIHYISL